MLWRLDNRAATFVTEEDNVRYGNWLAEAVAGHGCAIDGYVLMTNHVHCSLRQELPMRVAHHAIAQPIEAGWTNHAPSC
jgi:REP element-mobilizing transposase RayT